MENKELAIIQNKILVIRNQQVMIDRDIAELYGVETRILNQAVKRNMERFPNEFCFQLNEDEFEKWKSQFVISNSIKMGLRKRPFAFTEQGVAMLSADTRLTAQDIRSFNAQYPTLTVKHTSQMHDRFLIIDNRILYHVGASLKDLGKKCFAFDLFDASFIPDILAKVM